MKPINIEFPTAEELKIFGLNDGKKCTEVLQAKKYHVESFSELVALTSLLSCKNKKYILLYRGQTERFGLSFKPSIYRNISAADELKLRFEKLEQATNVLLKHESIPSENQKIIAWSIIQHYFDKIGTPLLDLTQSLRVAYSFAMPPKKNNREYVYIYVFGVHYPSNMISSDDEITNIRLLSLHPLYALRPSFQEGYLVCCKDIEQSLYKDIEEHDFKNRLIAEIEIPFKELSDDQRFHKIPDGSLLNNQIDTFFSKIKVKREIEKIYE